MNQDRRMTLTDEQRERLQAAAEGRENGSAAAVTAPALVLAESRVDLVALMREGLPEAGYVPGCEGWLRAGKRYLSPAPAGEGKSIAWLVVAVTAVEGGARVILLDVENGADEYATRLRDVLDARDPDGMLADACQERLQYHAWPRLSLSWSAAEWAAAVAGADLVIFDSSRMALTSVGLGEDKADDYAIFVGKLLIPLAKAGTTTVVLDNTGHEHKDRARGTVTKSDLNEVVYRLVVGAPFDRARTGNVRLVRRRSRFGDTPREIRIELGGGVYAPPVVVADMVNEEGDRAFRPTVLMERLSRAIESTPGMTQNSLLKNVRGNQDAKCTALGTLIAEGYVEARSVGQANHHYSLERYREAEDDRS